MSSSTHLPCNEPSADTQACILRLGLSKKLTARSSLKTRSDLAQKKLTRYGSV
ncbi:hypothetical protein HanRHA438_Chr05g0240151 [Helianthus annuus]|nr:hypothetical protein HanHA89_Chr05g0203861 [Helianthus annuus]KAJ0920334.1 hypothetical protein HanRHA438_Chr05g0240151 [Helianthus annuus]